MTFTLKPKTYWAAGRYDEKDGCIYFAEIDGTFQTPQAVLDHFLSEGLDLGPCGLVFIHVQRTSRKSTLHYFQSFRAANRFLTKAS